jgi:hypothetical protein
MTLLAMLLLSIVPRDDTVRESVDLIELNHTFNENGDPNLCQLIYYHWHRDRYEVIAWRMLKSPLMVPYRDHTHGGYTAVWVDDRDTLRVVRSKDFRESWTQYDVELWERNQLPANERRELRPSRVLKR